MTLVIAHRGFSGKFPENTLLSFQKAVEAGVDGVEFDVMATKDGKLVVFHDKNLKRLCSVKKKISETTLFQLEQFKVGGEKIPTLDEVLKYLHSTSLKFIVMEVKVEDFEEELLEIIWKYDFTGRLIISSLSSDFLEKVRSLDSEVKLGYVVDNRPDKIRKWGKLHKKVGLYSVHLFHKRPISTKSFAKMVKKKGLVLFAWFSRWFDKMERLPELEIMGFDGIMTDYPDKAKKVLKLEFRK